MTATNSRSSKRPPHTKALSLDFFDLDTPLPNFDQMAAYPHPNILKQELKDLTERVNTALQNAASDLKDLDLGVPAYIELYPCVDDTETYLGFDRYEGKWQFVIQQAPVNAPDCATVRPLSHASRKDRSHAVHALPNLFQRVLYEAIRAIRKMHGHVQQIASLQDYITAVA